MLPYCKSKENIKEVLPYILDSTIVKRETSTTSKAVDFPIKLFGSISFGHFFKISTDIKSLDYCKKSCIE